MFTVATPRSGKREEKATEKNLVFLVDFQTRAHPSYQEAVRIVHAGGIGKIVSGEASYQTGGIWLEKDKAIRENPTDPEARIRGWGADKTLSGDIITEQNIHAIDVASWIMDAAPVRAWEYPADGAVPLCQTVFGTTSR